MNQRQFDIAQAETLASQLSAVLVPYPVISVEIYQGNTKVHLPEDIFKDLFQGFSTRDHGGTEPHLYLSAKIGDVEFFTLEKVEVEIEA